MQYLTILVYVMLSLTTSMGVILDVGVIAGCVVVAVIIGVVVVIAIVLGVWYRQRKVSQVLIALMISYYYALSTASVHCMGINAGRHVSSPMPIIIVSCLYYCSLVIILMDHLIHIKYG